MKTEAMELTNFHLRRRQKAALRARARANGTNVAEEIRNAVDAYLSGVTSEELELLDEVTRRVADAISEMVATLDATNRKADAVFAELDSLRRGRPTELSVAEAGALYAVKRKGGGQRGSA